MYKTVYHGTTFERFENIIKTKFIKPRIKLAKKYHNWDDRTFDTTPLRMTGVFVTSKKSQAAVMAQASYNTGIENYLVVIELRVNVRRLKEDKLLGDDAYVIPTKKGIGIKEFRGIVVLMTYEAMQDYKYP